MYLLIAKILGEKKETVGYRLIDVSKIGREDNIKDVDVASLVKAINGGTSVINAEVNKEKNGIKGTNGSLERYTSLTLDGKAVDKIPLVVIFRAKEKLLCCNYAGSVSFLSNEEALKYSEGAGIANGKIVNRGGKNILSSISGEYPDAPEELLGRKEEIFVTVSNDKSAEDNFKAVISAKTKSKKLIGKINAEETDKLIQYIIVKNGLLAGVAKKDNEMIGKAAVAVLNYLEWVAKVGDKKVIVKHAVGLKAVKADVASECGDLYDRVIKVNETKKIQFASKLK